MILECEDEKEWEEKKKYEVNMVCVVGGSNNRCTIILSACTLHKAVIYFTYYNINISAKELSFASV